MSSPTTPLRPTAAAAAAGSSSSGSSYQRRRHGRPGGLRRPRVRRCKMKLMYFLMDRDEQRSKRLELEFEVSELETALDKEQRLGRVLQCSLQGRVVCHCCLSALVPNKVRALLGELAMVEDEIFYLEKKVDALRLRLHRERKWNDQCGVAVQQTPPRPPRDACWPQGRQPRHSTSCGSGCRKELLKGLPEQVSRLPCSATDEALECESKASVGSASAKDEEAEHARRSSHCHSSETPPPPERKICLNSPNKLSEELISLTVTIFHKLNKTAAPELEPKLNISCIGSRSLVVPKTGAAAAAMSPLKGRSSSRTTPKQGERGAAANKEDAAGPAGGHRRFVEFTRSSVDVGRVSLCLVDIKNLRGLMQKLSAVDPSFLTNKQKLAFWINIYNFCVMHAFLQHGLPPSPDKLLALLNQASVNVGGTVLNVLTIEHLILRHSPDGKQGIVDDGERALLRSYGLGFPEPNVIFALCRGSRSSPALRVYSADDVSNELELAKVEYLETWVRVVGGRRQRAVAVPRLLHWHMRDFADDAASLLEWVHSQLPTAAGGPLKRAIREVLGRQGQGKVVVEVEPYDAEFCYLLPVL
ncbi:hypothetical protein QOZ80_1AG0009670 [Eleusine coracana subsp. coracana]|nr:hypothetical protein QOZ80_1AG0009670 [Eleusine coracana subsp. coracana]